VNAVQPRDAWLDQDELIHLVRAAQRGDAGAVDLLLTKLRPSFLKFFARRIGRDAAEDAAQLALISIASALPGIDAERAGAYVVTVARNGVRKARRRRAREARRFVPVELAEAVESPVTADREVEYHDLARALQAGLAALRPALRDVLLGPLRELGPSTLAAEEHVGPATIRSRRRYARARLRLALAPYAEGLPAGQ
jgi:RNA polymerase sigma factor (sigma-70 family)